ncbi:MAG: aldo/keto reductase [Actinobacteria bacterium]|nr:aldo/keto reductase [Actinomycetota bacterium]
MQYAGLGDSGLMVSRLALGLAFRGQTDEREMERTIARALDQGINFFDCANDYGRTPTDPYGGPAERAL